MGPFLTSGPAHSLSFSSTIRGLHVAFLWMCVYILKRLYQLTFQGTLKNTKQQKVCLSQRTAAASRKVSET